MKEMMKRILACCMALSVYGNIAVFAQETETPEETVESENPENTAYVKDECELLTQAEAEELNADASEVADKYNCGVYVRVFNDMGSYEDIESFAESVYTEESLGLGEGQNGVMLILSLSGKDYYIFVYGEDANKVFTDDAKDQMMNAIVSDMDNDDFYNAFKTFSDIAEEDLEAKANEEPEQPDSPYLAEYDVTEYGVNGTDTEDDNALINNLLHEASLLDNPENKPILIHFPEGIYYLNNPLFVFSNMILQLDDNAVIKRSDLSVCLLRSVHNDENGKICDGENCKHGSYNKIHDVIIEGGTWDGNTNSNTAVSYNTLLSFDHGSDITIRNTKITNASAIHFIVFDGIKNGLVDHVTLTNQYLFTGDDDFYNTVYEKGYPEKVSPTGNYNCYMLSCSKEAVHMDYTDSDGSASYPLDHTACQNITVQSCTFDNVLSGTGGHHTSSKEPKQTGIVIKDNSFKNVKGIVVNLYDMPDFQVLDNTVEGSMLYSAQQFSKGVLKNNVLNGVYRYCYLSNGEMSAENENVIVKDPYNFKESTVLLINGKADIKKMNIQLPDDWNGKDYAVPVRNNSELNMSDSKITGVTVGAVYAGNNGKINLDKVTITGKNKDAKIAFGSNGSGSVKNCTISKTKDAIDIWSGSSNVTISGNTISQCENAIGVYSAGKNISITNNKISGPTVSGIHVDSTGVNVTGNTLTNIPKTINGIVLSSVTSSSTVMNNTVEGGKYGINIRKQSSNITIRSNVVKNAAETGFRIVESKNLSIMTNVALNTTGGLDFAIYNSSGSQFTDNVVTSSLSKNLDIWPKDSFKTNKGNMVKSSSWRMKGLQFIDVQDTKLSYYQPVYWAVDKGITQGTTLTTFSPGNSCTRAQFVTFLWRQQGSPEPKTSTNPFKDVKAGLSYSKAVLWALENGITTGTSDTTFSPDSPCTRAQVVTFLWRAKNKPKPKATKNPFTDVKAGMSYSDAVLWAYENNITTGTSKTTFSPRNACTRAQTVTFLYRTFK